MTNKLVFIALILFMSSSVYSLKLGNICMLDVFEYNGLEVNTFYKLPTHVSLDPNESFAIFNQKIIYLFLSHQITFPSVGSFCFNEIDVRFPNENDQSEFESIKRNHTSTIIELLSEKNLNNRTGIVFRLYSSMLILNKLKTRVFKLKNRYSTDYYNRLLNPIQDLITENIRFIYLLIGYFDTKFPYMDDLKSRIKKEKEMKKLGDLIRNLDLSNENQIMAFNNLKIEGIYNQKIVQVSNFTLNRHSKLIYDFRSTSTLYYDVVLPFHDKNYDGTSADCTIRWDLPGFYWRLN